ncbi:MAG: hemolysin activation/secretion protein [Verrucomicrobiales bacterium]|jgi:hemolysin activation/secretion protein
MNFRPNFFSTLCLVLGPGLLWAQEGEIVDRARAPGESARREAEAAQAPELPDLPESEADDTPLGVKLIELRLISHQDKIDPDSALSKAESGPVSVGEEVDLPEELAETLEGNYIGAELSLRKLEELARDIVLAYRETDFPLVDAYFPEQNISLGKLQVVIREAVLGEVRIEGATRSKPDYLIGQVRIEPGDRINSRILEADVEWLNENPSRTVDLIYERGEKDGASDVVLRTEDGQQIQGYVGFGNPGVNATGEEEWAGGFSISNFLGTEQFIGYSFSGDAELDNLNAHALIYQIPLPWRHRIEILGAWVVSNSTIPDAILPFDVDGESYQTTIDYRIPLPKPRSTWRSNFRVAWDFKSTNTDILFGGASFFDTTAEVFQFRAGYDLTIRDDAGETRLDLGVAYSPGNVTGHNVDEDFGALREGSVAEYFYGTARLERLHRLPAEFGLVLRAEGQFSGDRLISTEQLLAGGYRSVRGFDENLVRGDSGAIFSSELHLPSISMFKKERSTFFLFYDAAWLSQSDSLPGETDPTLHGVGLGVNGELGDRLRFRASYGWRVGETGLEGVELDDGKLHFGMTVRF